MTQTSQTENLDVILNQAGFDLATTLEKNTIEKLLGILAKDGVYAMWLWALNNVEKNDLFKLTDSQILDTNTVFVKFLATINNINTSIWTTEILNKVTKVKIEIKNLETEIKKLNDKNIKKQKQYELKTKQNELIRIISVFFLNLSSDLNNLLFFKYKMEKALTYARYHAKIMDKIND